MLNAEHMPKCSQMERNIRVSNRALGGATASCSTTSITSAASIRDHAECLKIMLSTVPSSSSSPNKVVFRSERLMSKTCNTEEATVKQALEERLLRVAQAIQDIHDMQAPSSASRSPVPLTQECLLGGSDSNSAPPTTSTLAELQYRWDARCSAWDCLSAALRNKYFQINLR